jgi:hypothetical protein
MSCPDCRRSFILFKPPSFHVLLGLGLEESLFCILLGLGLWESLFHVLLGLGV